MNDCWDPLCRRGDQSPAVVAVVRGRGILVTIAVRRLHPGACRADGLCFVRVSVLSGLFGPDGPSQPPFQRLPRSGTFRADVGENDGHEEDGVDSPRRDHHAHDLEEGPEEVGLGHEQHGHAHEGRHAPVKDRPRGMHQSVAGTVLAQRLFRHEVGGADVGREVHREADAHQDVDHRHSAVTSTKSDMR